METYQNTNNLAILLVPFLGMVKTWPFGKVGLLSDPPTFGDKKVTAAQVAAAISAAATAVWHAAEAEAEAAAKVQL